MCADPEVAVPEPVLLSESLSPNIVELVTEFDKDCVFESTCVKLLVPVELIMLLELNPVFVFMAVKSAEA